MSNPILSICIPTKNRSKYLDFTIRSIIRQKRFQETGDVEIVVSDNGSTDTTPNICHSIIMKYSDKIKYIQMEEPTFRAESNYLNVLKHGTGTFLKLHNDNMLVKDGGLDEMINVINIWKAQLPVPVIFFANNPDPTNPYIVQCRNFDLFILHASYMCTWIGGFGIWKYDLLAIEKMFPRNKDTLLCQVDMLREMISVWGRQAIVCNKFIFPSIDVSKGTFNIAEVFGQNYLGLIKDHVSWETFQIEKEKLLKEFIIPYYFDKSGKHNFQRTGFFKYMKEYWEDEFFYDEIEKLLMEEKA